jgi:hypothetical protein
MINEHQVKAFFFVFFLVLEQHYVDPGCGPDEYCVDPG